MAFWITKINWRKVILSAAVYTVISFVVHQVESVLTVKYYMMQQYFGVWSSAMMSRIAPLSTNFFVMSLVFTFVTGVSLALIYYYIKDQLPVDTKRRIFYFADLMIGASFVFFTLPVYLMFNVPVGLLISWFISSFIILTAGSAVFVKILK